MIPDPGLEPVLDWAPDPATAPAPDPAAEPEGFMVATDAGVRLHFLDWGDPAGVHDDGSAAGDHHDGSPSDGPGLLLLPGLLAPAWTWTPVARRVARTRRTVVADLRGQGLSDAPADGYAVDVLADDAIAVADGAGLLRGRPLVVAGHGFGAVVAAAAAGALGSRCAGLVLVDGGWERLEETTGVDVDEFLRGLDEPPEVMRTMSAYLSDRRGYDPASWDADQERAARDAVVETAAGHVVRAVRPHAVEALVRAMFAYDPASALAGVEAPVTAMIALGGGDAAVRLAELRRSAAARAAAGRSRVRATAFPSDAHNLVRYRPAEVAATILAAHR
jgi:pimeloyl-ACP methyl ester carboxylesterase